MPNLTYAPLPSGRDIFKAIFPLDRVGKDLAKPWLLSDSDIPYWFSRSTFILLAIAKWWKAYTNKKSPTIWIPDYFCNQSLQEHTLEYAKLAKDRGIDIMIDGGINLQTASKIQQIAPQSVVIGGGLFGKTIEQQQQLIAKLTMDPQG